MLTQLTQTDTANGNTKEEEPFARNEKGRFRHWFLTENNFNCASVSNLKKLKTKYLVFQTEICPTTGTPHYHACMTFQNARSFESIKKKFPRANIQRVHQLQNAREYCMKPGSWSGTRFERIGNNIIQDIVGEAVEHQKIPSWEDCVRKANAGFFKWYSNRWPEPIEEDPIPSMTGLTYHQMKWEYERNQNNPDWWRNQ